MGEEIIVSVIMPSFNHEKYICQAIDSVLSQKTDFEFEILVGDDASTDDTQKIVLSKYAGNKRVRLFLRKKNVGATRNGYALRMHARGKYLCACECDDYWIDEYYLQTVVDWMEAHEGYAGVVARRIRLSEKTGRKSLNKAVQDCNCNITINDFIEGKAMFDMCTCLYLNFMNDRKSDYRMYKLSKHVGDLTMAIHILMHGKIYQLDNIIGVYRTDRIKDASNYNSLYKKRDIYMDHMNIIKYMEKYCYPELDYSYLQQRYTNDFWKATSFGVEKINAILLIMKEMPPILFLRWFFKVVFNLNNKNVTRNN